MPIPVSKTGGDNGGGHPISGVATSITAFVGRTLLGPVNHPVTLTSLTDMEQQFGGLWAQSLVPVAVRDFFQNGGVEAIVVRLVHAGGDPQSNGDALVADDFIGPNLADGEGLHALDQADLFNLLVIPPYTGDDGGGNPLDVDAAVIGAAARYCEQRRAFLVIDSPSTWQPAATTIGTIVADAANLTGVLGTNSPNAAVFLPRLQETDSSGGAIAGVFARTDAERGVWQAPAGLSATLAGTPSLSRSIPDADSAQLNAVGINTLRVFPNSGPVVWGSRTLQGADTLASEWKYIAVRRMALYIEESLDRGLRWVVFEPNGETLWGEIQTSITAFMDGLFRQSAFQGTRSTDAYFVKCDSSTTTQNDIANGIVNIVVGFAPIKPAEFVIINFQEKAGPITPKEPPSKWSNRLSALRASTHIRPSSFE